MTARHRQRLWLVVAIVVIAGLATGMLVYALRANMNLFYTPQQLMAGEAPAGREIRAGGVVKPDSLHRAMDDSVQVMFTVTDFKAELRVIYDGILPDLFREGQGVVVMGRYNSELAQFEATQVLAKHDENYTPPELDDVMARNKAAMSAQTRSTPRP